jgi:hypothetical protein
VPDIGQATVTDPGLADFEARRLLQRHLDLDLAGADDLDVVLVDADGQPVYVFELLFTSDPGSQAGAADSPYARLAADPPAGCWFEDFGGNPGLHCVRRGSSRFEAIATLIAEVRDTYGLDANDLGFEKLWEWAGSREWRERMIAHLLVMAADRARLTGVPASYLIDFLGTAMSDPPPDALRG